MIFRSLCTIVHGCLKYSNIKIDKYIMVGSIILGLVCTSSFSCTLHEMYKQHTDKQFITATDQFIDTLQLHWKHSKEWR